MKKILRYFAMIAIAGTMFTSCRSAAPAVTHDPSLGRLQEQRCEQIIFEAPEGMFRASGNAVADNRQFAINQARLQARAALAQQLQTEIEGLIRRFDQEHGVSRDASSISRASEVIQGYVNQAVQNSRPICQDVFVLDNGRFNAFVAYQMPMEQAARNAHRQLTRDQIIHVDFQEAQFMEQLEAARKQFYQNRR